MCRLSWSLTSAPLLMRYASPLWYAPTAIILLEDTSSTTVFMPGSLLAGERIGFLYLSISRSKMTPATRRPRR